MLKKGYRFSKRKEIGEVLSDGESVRGEYWLVKSLKKNDEEKLFSVVVSKKVSKKAVIRNRIRRLIYEAIRKKIDKFEPGSRMIFLVNSKILKIIDEKNSSKIADLV